MEFVPTTAAARPGVAEIRFVTPTNLAREIVDQTDETVWVRCSSCNNVVSVGKRFWRPVSFQDLNGPEIETRRTAAPARVCGACIAGAAKKKS